MFIFGIIIALLFAALVIYLAAYLSVKYVEHSIRKSELNSARLLLDRLAAERDKQTLVHIENLMQVPEYSNYERVHAIKAIIDPYDEWTLPE